MNALDHFVISHHDQGEDFKDMTKMAENLDRDDFLDTSYFVDKNVYGMRAGKSTSTPRKGGSSSRKSKEKTASQRTRESEPSRTDSVVNLDSEEEREDVGADPVEFSTPQTPFTGAASNAIPEPSDARGSSASSGEPRVTPGSSSRQRKKKRASASTRMDPSLKAMMDMFKEEMAENKKARRETDKRFDTLMTSIPDIVKGVVVGLVGPKPIQWIDPSQGQSQQLMITNQAQASADSARQAYAGSANPSPATTASAQTPAQPSPIAAPNLSEVQVVHEGSAGDGIDAECPDEKMEDDQEEDTVAGGSPGCSR